MTETVKDKAIAVLRRAKRPLSTMEIVGRVYPHANQREQQEIRPIIYAKLSSLIKWGEVRRIKKGTVTYWELIR